MKTFMIGLLFISALSAQAKTCLVTQSKNNDTDFNQELARYENIEKGDIDFITLIKNNGEVIKDFKIEDVQNLPEAQREEKLKELQGSKLAIISSDEEEDQLVLAIGRFNLANGEAFEGRTLGTSDINSKNSAIFDLEENLSIFCVK